MSQKMKAPYGSWKSIITTDLMVAGSVNLGGIGLDGPDVYWLEGRPEEAGRNVLVRQAADGGCEDVTPAPFNIRTRVHEYGGSSYTIRDGCITFSNFADQRLYQHCPGEEPVPVTPEEKIRFADGVFTPDGRFICVREDHRVEGQEAQNSIVALKLDGQDDGLVLASGRDFYATPRLSPDGKKLAWLSWNHPNMPWDGSELWAADLEKDGGLRNLQMVAGGDEESVFQPQWSPDGNLHFVSDRSGWWNHYRWQGAAVELLHAQEADFGLPQWVFGMRTYDFVDAQTILTSRLQDGKMCLAFLNSAGGDLQVIDLPYTFIFGLQVQEKKAYFLGAAPDISSSIVCLDLATFEHTVLRKNSDIEIPPEYVSIPQPVEFPTAGGLTAHAFYYPPANAEYQGPEGERPPLVVMSHGGPTGATYAVLSLEKLYWTSRGFAVLDVNYGGSTGYGRAYRQRLNGQWGIVDVVDCINGAKYVAGQGWADGERLTIRGGSAGGYTTLCALTFHDDFSGGASLFGVSDVEALAKETHKFESRYMDNLIGPYPESRDIYIERSPIHFADQISCPLILLQGLEDRIVLPNQAEMMFEAVKANGIPVAYLPFEGEQHGFRRSENIKRALEAEYYFYARVFGFETADEIEPVAIENLES